MSTIMQSRYNGLAAQRLLAVRSASGPNPVECNWQLQSIGSLVDAGAALECGPDHVLRGLVLMPDRGAGQDEAVQAAAPKDAPIGGPLRTLGTSGRSGCRLVYLAKRII